jgi:hypothetical protein
MLYRGEKMITCTNCDHCTKHPDPSRAIAEAVYCDFYHGETWNAEGMGLECALFTDRINDDELHRLYRSAHYWEWENRSFEEIRRAYDEWSIEISTGRRPVIAKNLRGFYYWMSDFFDYTNEEARSA